MKQISDDKGTLADLLNGFSGESLTIGPIVTYGFKLKGLLPVETSFRRSPSVYSRNRLSGDTFMFTVGLPLPFSLPKHAAH